ncbi:hypothetical protein FDECE_17583, partial [Fusarium decemcellulare]
MELLVLIILAVSLFTLWLLYPVAQSITSGLRTIPGPFLARFTDCWYFWKIWKGSYHVVNAEIHHKYGPVVRYGPNRYSFNDPEALKVIYGLGNHFPKSSWYSAWKTPKTWTMFADDVIKRHTHNRKQYQGTYAMSSLIHYEPFVDQCAEIFDQRLWEISQSQLSVDMRHWFQIYAFDVISMITYAKRIGFLDRGEDIGNVIGALDDHLKYGSLVGVFPSLHPFIALVRNWLSGDKGRAHVQNFSADRMREVQTAPKAVIGEKDATGTEDFLTKFMAKHAANPDVFTSYHVLAGCTSNMVAGS